MSVETIAENGLTCREAVRYFPTRNGQRMSLRTIHRFIADGLLSLSGERVRLKAWRVGRAWYTTKAAIKEFIERLNETPETAAQADREDLQRRDQAAREGLKALGCM